MVKRLPAIRETWVRSLGREDSPGEGNGNPLLPGKSHGRRSLIGYSPWGRKESDTTERLHFLSLSPLLTFMELRRVGALLWFELWLKEMIFYLDHRNFLHISKKPVSLSYYSYVHLS